MLQSSVYQKNLVTFVVDEAHCIKYGMFIYTYTYGIIIMSCADYRGDIFRECLFYL